jgi:hypothetical protein
MSRLQAEVERFEQWAKMHVAPASPLESTEEPVQNWFDSHSWGQNDLPHPNSTPLPGSIDWLYQDIGGEA